LSGNAGKCRADAATLYAFLRTENGILAEENMDKKKDEQQNRGEALGDVKKKIKEKVIALAKKEVRSLPK